MIFNEVELIQVMSLRYENGKQEIKKKWKKTNVTLMTPPKSIITTLVLFIPW